MVLLENIKNKPKKSTKYKIFCDLDGVLADFVKGVKKILPEYDEATYLSDPKYRKKMWKVIGDYTKDGGKLWAELDFMPDAMVLWEYISKYDTTEILTATGDLSFGGDAQKCEWVAERLGGGIKTNVVVTSADKEKYAKPRHILIDDMNKSINPWKAAGGVGILHTSAADTIKKLKKLGV